MNLIRQVRGNRFWFRLFGNLTKSIPSHPDERNEYLTGELTPTNHLSLSFLLSLRFVPKGSMCDPPSAGSREQRLRDLDFFHSVVFY
jgi:hypothetical protein